MEHRDVALAYRPRRQGHRRDRPPAEAVDPAGDQQAEVPVAGGAEAGLEGREQAHEGVR
ncbi:MAG TPA: hypothetical protein VEQ11_08560 [Chloroflexota bacterium]|nr:hypothetical protein [Chloroflexota bacterium]